MGIVFKIRRSNKAGLNSKESYIVTRKSTCFLRILGSNPHYSLMTATAGEGSGYFLACKDQLRLTEAVLRLGLELSTKPKVEKDRMGREYVKICAIKPNLSDNQEEFNEKLSRLFSRFFELFDNYETLQSRPVNEMRDLYDALSVNGDGDDVYLSDGVWLSSDGSLHDRGR